MRSIIQFGVAATCIGLVGAGLFLSLNKTGKGLILERPGTPGRLIAETSTATAFFEMKGGQMELTMLFSDDDDPESVFRTRVTLAQGQSHSIVVGDSDDGASLQRFVFKRKGDTVAMSLVPASGTTTYVAGE